MAARRYKTAPRLALAAVAAMAEGAAKLASRITAQSSRDYDFTLAIVSSLLEGAAVAAAACTEPQLGRAVVGSLISSWIRRRWRRRRDASRVLRGCGAFAGDETRGRP